MFFLDNIITKIMLYNNYINIVRQNIGKIITKYIN